jgi:5,10-methylenetetrahydrofolate reductase
LDPPRGVNVHRLVEAAETVKASGADFINVADSPMARVRLSAMATCRILQERVQISTILHFTTRDRNLMGLQSDLLGAYTLGVKNVLCLTGDPPGLGDYAAATAVYDLDSIGLVKVTQALNRGVDAVGLKLGSPTAFEAGVGLNPNAESLADEVDRLRRKLDAGASFIMTQPVYEMEQLSRFVDAFGPIPVPLILGVMPLVSLRQAEYLNNEVPGISVPPAVLKRMEGQDSPEKGREIALEFIAQAAPLCQGVYLVPSFNRVEPLLPIIEGVGRAYRRHSGDGVA